METKNEHKTRNLLCENLRKNTGVHAHFIKCTVRPRTGHEGPEGEYSYTSTLSLTSALDAGAWLTPRHGHFTPGKETRYPLYRRMDGPEEQSGRVRKI